MAKAQYIATVYANSMGILMTQNVYHKISFKKKLSKVSLSGHRLKKLCGRKSFLKQHSIQKFP